MRSFSLVPGLIVLTALMVTEDEATFSDESTNVDNWELADADSNDEPNSDADADSTTDGENVFDEFEGIEAANDATSGDESDAGF